MMEFSHPSGRHKYMVWTLEEEICLVLLQAIHFSW